jgi:hypothetical protein
VFTRMSGHLFVKTVVKHISKLFCNLCDHSAIFQQNLYDILIFIFVFIASVHHCIMHFNRVAQSKLLK